MMEVRILDHCEFCDGEAYVIVCNMLMQDVRRLTAIDK